MIARMLCLCSLAALLGACASIDLPPATDVERFRIEQDEKRIWLESWKETDAIDRSGMVYEAPELEAYLNGIARRLQPPEVFRVIPFTVRIIRNPYLNAFTFPNGMIYVHSGLLAAMENEAEFAALLAHEMVHATDRHAVKELRNEKNRMAIAAAIRTVVGGHRGELSARASIAGYSQELEAEADEKGLALAVQAGYDPRDAVKLFQHLRDEVQEGGIIEPYFYGTHPRIQDRIDGLSRLLAARYANVTGGSTNAGMFFRHIADLILDNAELDIRAGRYRRAERSLARYLLHCMPHEGRPHFLLGELYRQRGHDGDLERAQTAYDAAIAADPDLAAAYRGMGLVLLRRFEDGPARTFLRDYLARAPQAPDRAYIEVYLKEPTP